MLLTFTVTLSLFVLILAGFVSARKALIDQAGVRGLTGFVFYFALPLMLFHNMATAPVAEKFDGRYVLAYLAAGICVQLLGMGIAKWVFRRRLDEQALQGIASSFGNTVFIALPVASELFGPKATLPMALIIAIENGVLMPLAVALLEIARTGGSKTWGALTGAGRAILRNPVVMSVILGAAAAVVGVKLPPLFDGIVRLVRGANVPCALFALGASLSIMPLTERLREISSMVFLKLAVYPAVVYCTMTYVIEVDALWQAVAVLSASVPMGANVYLLAARYETYVARASTAVLVSTIISVVTVSGLALVLHG
jgi:malonate transporter